jgi:hypothetical protein
MQMLAVRAFDGLAVAIMREVEHLLARRAELMFIRGLLLVNRSVDYCHFDAPFFK